MIQIKLWKVAESETKDMYEQRINNDLRNIQEFGGKIVDVKFQAGFFSNRILATYETKEQKL